MAGQFYFVVVGAKDNPIYETEFSGRGSSDPQYRVSNHYSDNIHLLLRMIQGAFHIKSTPEITPTYAKKQ